MTTKRTAARKAKHAKEIWRWKERVRRLVADRILMRVVLRECEQSLVDEIYTFRRPAAGRSAQLLGRIREVLK